MSLSENKKKLKAVIGNWERKRKDDDEDAAIVGFGSDLNIGTKKWARFDLAILDEFTGSVPCGKFSVLAGPEKSGKSTLCARLAANVQRRGGIVAWADIENQLDPAWLRLNGVDPDALVIIQGNIYEKVMDKVRDLLRSGAISLMVVDSITALASLQELYDKKGTRSMEDNTVAIQARKNSQFFRMTTGIVGKSGCAVVLIGQVRTPIGTYGSLEMIPGGNALKHYCSYRLLVRRGRGADAPTDEDDKRIGFNCVIKLDKVRSSQAVNEGKEVAVPFVFGKGFVVEQARVFTAQDKQAEDDQAAKVDGAW